MDQVQVDAHWLDIKIVTSNKLFVAGKIWAIVIADVKTANILGYSLSLKAPAEEDFMMALRCSMEPKDSIVKKYNCENNWPCRVIPRKILSDNGKIFISERARDVLVKRLGIIEEIAPPYAPSVKGTIESLFTWIVRRLTSKLPGFTKDRDPNEVKQEVLKASITFDVFEEMFVRAIVDSYNQDWDDLRGQTRYNLWVHEENQNRFIIPQWLGSKDELKLLLMKEDRNRKVDRHGISFMGRFYQNVSMLRDVLGQRVNIRYDKRDISVIYVYLNDGQYYCEAYCSELMGIRLSVWEDKILKSNNNKMKDIHRKYSRASINKITSNRKRNTHRELKEKEAQFIEQAKIYDNDTIHIDKVNEVFSKTRPELQNEYWDNEIMIDMFDIEKLKTRKLNIRKL